MSILKPQGKSFILLHKNKVNTCKSDHCQEAKHRRFTIPKSIVGSQPSLRSLVMEDTGKNTGVTLFQYYHKTLHVPPGFGRNIYLSKSSKKNIEKDTSYSPENEEKYGAQHTCPIKTHTGSRKLLDNISGKNIMGFPDRNSFRVRNIIFLFKNFDGRYLKRSFHFISKLRSKTDRYSK